MHNSLFVAGACWQKSVENGKCTENISTKMTRDECCAISSTFSYTERDISHLEIFFIAAYGNTMECSPCVERCKQLRCSKDKKCVQRKGKVKCVCAPKCAALLRKAEQKNFSNHLPHQLNQEKLSSSHRRMYRSNYIDAVEHGYALAATTITTSRSIRSLSRKIATINLELADFQQRPLTDNSKDKSQRKLMHILRQQHEERYHGLHNSYEYISTRGMKPTMLAGIGSGRLRVVANVERADKKTTRRLQVISNVEQNHRRNGNYNVTSIMGIMSVGTKTKPLITGLREAHGIHADFNNPMNNLRRKQANNRSSYKSVHTHRQKQYTHEMDRLASKHASTQYHDPLKYYSNTNTTSILFSKSRPTKTAASAYPFDLANNKRKSAEISSTPYVNPNSIPHFTPHKNKNNSHNRKTLTNDIIYDSNKLHRFPDTTKSTFMEHFYNHGVQPVCGTDGRTYNTECQLKKRSCRTDNPNLIAAYIGHCKHNCDRVKCIGGLTCVEDQYGIPHCIACNTQCPFDDHSDMNGAKVVCGVDGNTYKSVCDINRMICRIGRSIAVAYPGQCRSNRVNCSNINCGSRHVCLMDLITHKPRCVSCRYKCAQKHRRMEGPICGANNRTYSSWCEIRKDSCSTGFYIDIKYFGKCH